MTTRLTTLPELLTARLAADGASPLLTCYDDATGERTELSASTFANWVAKTANLVVDGLGLGPGDTAAVTLPLHWQSLVVVAGCWSAGLAVVLGGASGDLAVGAEGWDVPDGGETLLLSLRPMGAGLQAPRPDVTDFAADVRGYGDRFTGPGPTGDTEALDGRTHAALTAAAGDDRRLLLAPEGDPPLDAALLRDAYVSPLLGGGSVVLCRHADRAGLAHRAEVERAVSVS
jgi:uncharacterized protein (TIGR03089 family)